VKAYNINKGRNVEIANRSPTLSGYEEFVAEINENLKTMSLPSAIKAAIRSCVSKNILLSFLKDNGSEVENMLLSEWNMKDALVVAREEGMEDGIAIGMEKGEAKARQELFALLESGVSLAEAKRKFGY
jgi:hypothetical protein